MSTKVRVRFAPSPTGPLHIGGVRTALYNYLFAKKHKGDFLLRIEDTDQNRFVEGAEQYIIDSLDWCGIPYDEGPGKNGGYGPYRQSERAHLYKEFADRLLESGNAYYAFDTPEALDSQRKEHEEKGKTFIYNWHNRLKLNNSLSLSKEEVQQKINSGEPYVIRFKIPESETLNLEDEIRGKMEVETSTLDDKVLFKSDGLPTYHLANIVDDHLMEISHVIRGEEWLPSLALHILLYRAFGWTPPKFAHLPLILKPQGKGKLSKRDGDKLGFPVFPLEWKDPKTGEISKGYREENYLPEAMVNMLSLLGWNPGTEQEFFNLDDLIKVFDISRVHKSGAKFDPEKTKWFQQHYIQLQPEEKLAEQFNAILEAKGISSTPKYVMEVVVLLKERAVFVDDFWDLGKYFFEAPKEFEEKSVNKVWKEDTTEIMTNLVGIINNVKTFTADKIQEDIKGWVNAHPVGFGKVMQPFRLSLVGSMQGPDVFEIAALLGKNETVKRLNFAIEKNKF